MSLARYTYAPHSVRGFDPNDSGTAELVVTVPGAAGQASGSLEMLTVAEQKKLLASAKTTTPFFVDSADTFTTVSAVTERDWVRAIRSAMPPLSPALTGSWNGTDSHFATSAFMLTHAMYRSGF